MSLLRGIEDDDDAPPSYTDSIVPSSSLSFASPSSPTGSSSAFSPGILPPTLTSSLTSTLTNHLRTLPARLNLIQHARATEQASRELDIITYLVPSIESFLNDYASLHPLPPTAELTIVPTAAVPTGWLLSGAAERRKEGELVRVLKVNIPSKNSNGDFLPNGGQGEKGGRRETQANDDGDFGDRSLSSPSQEAGFDEWGRFECEETDGPGGLSKQGWSWFKDEDMARRLATYLRPEVNVERKQVAKQVVENKKAVAAERGSIWGRWGRGGKKEKEQRESVLGPTGLTGIVAPGPAVENREDGVKMSVRAREVTFRKENDFGVWEGRSGFGIVVTVRVTGA
ncbi:hypothetical protein QBC38DRAFT_80193 [Podospora fimiseda]|uniref:Uncharacterized protein n=1 Tax=Podospora fimiseda TaxID=252190 RepID=A0AAN6YR26_9PEZI|nr:hypothetical protein QBC38DRAFT_80193 [Podospora fimiseda]